MAASSEEASNAISSSFDAPEVQPKEVSSGGEGGSSVPDVEEKDGAIADAGEGSDGSGEEDSVPGDDDGERALNYARELIDKGVKLSDGGDHTAAVDCLSRAVEIHVACYGELAPECVRAYYEYGRALLSKAQEEADPLAHVPKQESDSGNPGIDKTGNGETSECSIAPVVKDLKEESASVITGENGEGSSYPCATDDKQESVSSHIKAVQSEEGAVGARNMDEADDEEGNEDEDLEDADEDESDLDLAWKSLDVARVISEKQPEDSLLKVDILSVLGEVALEREDIETSLSDYRRALSMLEKLVESDSRRIAELNFRICLVLEMASRTDEAIPYCQKAISVCRARMERLKLETEAPSGSGTNVASEVPMLEINPNDELSLNGPQSGTKEEEIETLAGLLADLEKKLEDLQQAQAMQNPKSVVSELLKMLGCKSNGNNQSETSAGPLLATSSQIGGILSSSGLDSPTASTGATSSPAGSAVTDLGVVGRGIKRATLHPIAPQPPSKKPDLDSQ